MSLVGPRPLLDYEINNWIKNQLVLRKAEDLLPEHVKNINNKVKRVSMELMRNKPQDWNNFMDALLSGY